MIIQTLLDTDLYKFTMMQCILHQFPAATARYVLQCRNNFDLAPYLTEIQAEVAKLCQLSFTDSELKFLATLPYFKPDFIAFLRLFRFNSEFIKIYLDERGQLAVDIHGPWLHTIMFEVPVLAIISEVYARNAHPQPNYELGRDLLNQKIQILNNTPNLEKFIFFDFGTRRRFSRSWQAEVIATLQAKAHPYFAGTSNLDLAHKLDLRPIGTMAHEFIQAGQGLGPRLIDSQKFALESWIREYRGHLGIALTDTISMEAFLQDFDLYFARIFDGLRQDSGDPFAWCEQALAHYQKLKIDPKTKQMVFSDNLTIPKAIQIYQKFSSRTNVSFGIGTNLTNDLGHTPPQIVIKMTHCNEQPAAKLSDDPSKIMCQDADYANYLRKVFSA